VLVGWAAGPKAAALERARSILTEAVASIARIFGRSTGERAAELEDWQIRNWRDDPFARGAYTWVPVGALDAPEALARPEADTLWFAGEGAHAEANGTVHGAIESGERAAAQVLAAHGAPAPGPPL
jgi:monoamine oxidase